eukprot:6829313-Prymnesium_polylepis.7
MNPTATVRVRAAYMSYGSTRSSSAQAAASRPPENAQPQQQLGDMTRVQISALAVGMPHETVPVLGGATGQPRGVLTGQPRGVLTGQPRGVLL